MTSWKRGDTVIVRNIARSDGTVTTAIPTIVVRDDPEVLAVFIPKRTTFKNNWVIPPEQRAVSVQSITPSAQRQYRNIVAQHNSLRLYLPGHRYSVGLMFDDGDGLISWYGNLEAPFIRIPLGIDTRDYALDVLAYPDGRWQWKDEAEFQRRLEAGIDSAAHHARVRAAGRDFITRFENAKWPFNEEWEHWRAPEAWQPRELPENWAADFGSHEQLSSDHR